MRFTRNLLLFVVFCGAVVILGSIFALHNVLVDLHHVGPPHHHVQLTDIITNYSSIIAALTQSIDYLSSSLLLAEKADMELVQNLSLGLLLVENKTNTLKALQETAKGKCPPSDNTEIPSAFEAKHSQLTFLGPLQHTPLLFVVSKSSVTSKVIEFISKVSQSIAQDQTKAFRIVVVHDGWSQVPEYLKGLTAKDCAQLVYPSQGQKESIEFWSLKQLISNWNGTSIAILNSAKLNVDNQVIDYFRLSDDFLESASNELICAQTPPSTCNKKQPQPHIHRTHTITLGDGILLSRSWVESVLKTVSSGGLFVKGGWEPIFDWMQDKRQRGNRDCLYFCQSLSATEPLTVDMFEQSRKSAYDQMLNQKVSSGNPTFYTTTKELQQMALTKYNQSVVLQNGIPLYSYRGVTLVYNPSRTASSTFDEVLFVNKLRFNFDGLN
eukprot:PhF_6_TR25833/c0_g1_i2/m.36491